MTPISVARAATINASSTDLAQRLSFCAMRRRSVDGLAGLVDKICGWRCWCSRWDGCGCLKSQGRGCEANRNSAEPLVA